MKPLAHDTQDHEAYGKAMSECQGYPPACSDVGECLHDGICFSNSGRGFRAARKKIEALIAAEQDVFTRCWLKHGLDALDNHQFIERGALDVMRYLQISKRIRQQYNAETKPCRKAG